MSLLSTFNLLKLRQSLIPLQYVIQTNNYAAPGFSLGKAKKMKGGAIVGKKLLPVETDVNKLLKFACGTNIYKEGQDVELKPDSEYPDWLWTLRTTGPPKLEEMDPNTKQYWRKVRKMGLILNSRKMAQRPF